LLQIDVRIPGLRSTATSLILPIWVKLGNSKEIATEQSFRNPRYGAGAGPWDDRAIQKMNIVNVIESFDWLGIRCRLYTALLTVFRI